jgi:hypothetical protein
MTTDEPKLSIPKAKRDNWESPPATFDALDKEFGPFDLDPACELHQYTALTILSRGGSVCIPQVPSIEPDFKASVLTRIHVDGLTSPWHANRVWLQPPYADLDKWIPKALAELEAGHVRQSVTALIPARTGPKWWQENIVSQCERWGGQGFGGQSDWWNNWSASIDHNTPPNTIRRTASLVRFLPGRIQFVGADQPANFDMAVVVWGKS